MVSRKLQGVYTLPKERPTTLGKVEGYEQTCIIPSITYMDVSSGSAVVTVSLLLSFFLTYMQDGDEAAEILLLCDIALCKEIDPYLVGYASDQFVH